ncbi:MAG TPA: ABC transporter permease [Opitutus sp.]|nr:ABC transporter permease [Opitutus sp.]
MHILLTLVAKDFALLRRNRGAFVLSIVVPILVIYIVGLVFGLGHNDSGPSGIPLAVVNQSDNPAALTLVDALRAEKTFRVITTTTNPDKSTRPLTAADLRPLIHDRVFSYALVIPADLVRADRFGIHLEILSDPRNDIENQIVNGMLQRTIFTSVPQLLGQSLQARAKNFIGADRLRDFNHALAGSIARNFGGDAAEIERKIATGSFLPGAVSTPSTLDPQPSTKQSADGDFLSRLVSIDREQVVGKDVKSPTATRVVGGYAVMFLLFALSNAAAAFADERNAGLFQRLLSSPASRGQLLWSRFIYGVLFGLIQLFALFLAGHFLYGVDVFGHFGGLLLVCASVAAACTGFGMVIAAITRSAEAARSLATLLTIGMSAVGGAWFPVSFMPEFMQRIAHFTIVYWAIEGFGAVLWAGNELSQTLPIVGILLGTTLVVMIVAVWRFNRSPMFD